MKQGYVNKAIILLIVFLIVFAVFLQKTTSENTQKLKDEEIQKSYDYASKIAKHIRLRTANNIEKTLTENAHLREHLNETLHAFLTNQYQYIFLLKKDKKDTYRFILDGSDEPEEFNTLFFPKSPLFDSVYKNQKTQIVKQTNSVEEVWISLVYPIVIKEKTEGLLVLDLSKSYGKKLSDFNSPLMSVVWMMQGILFISLLLLLFLAYTYYQTREALVRDKLTSTYTKYYLREMFNAEELEQYHAMLIDIDEFKRVNKKYGDMFGNRVLKLFANTMLKSLSSKSKVIRTIGTEFLVLVPKRDGEVEVVANKLFEVLQQKEYYYSGNKEIRLSISMSAMSIPEGTFSIQNILQLLDEKLLEVKSKGKNALGVIGTKSLDNVKYGNIDYIKEALSEERLLCLYQPIYNTKTKKITKYEALVRLIDKDDPEKLISPFFFMDVIKGTSQYIKMSKLVLGQVFDTLKLYPDIELTVNVDLDDLDNRDMMDLISDNLKEHKEIANRLTFEILEENEVTDYDKVENIFKQLKAYGSKIALDDFGSGYANYSYLIRLDIDILKIDGSLIRELQHHPIKAKLVLKSIQELAVQFNYKLVAEFVSHEDIYEMVKELDIEYSQGYYLGEPKPIKEYIDKHDKQNKNDVAPFLLKTI